MTASVLPKSEEQCIEDTKVIVDDLALAGFILN